MTTKTDKHEYLRNAHQAANDFKYGYVTISNSDLGALLDERDAARKVSKEAGAVVASLKAEMDALRAALEVIMKWPVTSPLNMDAHNMVAVAQAALAQGEA